MKRAAIYVRISTDHQETTRQKEELKAYAEGLGYTVVRVFEDVESGLSDTRKAFLELLTLTRKDIEAVFVWELSRIGRKTSTVIRTIENWADAGICFISKKENLMSLDDDGRINPNTKLFLSVMATIAEMEADTIKQRMMSGKIHKIRSGESAYTDRVPFGYRKEDGRLVVDEETAETVRDIFRMKIEGYPEKVICQATGLPQSSMQYILHNEVYKGVGRNKRIPGEVFEVPKIVDEVTWNKVQAVNPCIIKNSKCWHPLKMKVVCPVCGRHWSYLSPHQGRPGRFSCSKTPGAADGVHHPPYTAGTNADDLGDAVMKLVQDWRRTHTERSVATDTPKSIKLYLDALRSEYERKKRACELQEKKYNAIADMLTVTEKKAELRQIANARESLENTEMDIFEAQKRYDNAIALAPAFWTGTEEQPWYELVKEVRVVEWGADGKSYEVETVTGEVLECYVPTRKPRFVKGVNVNRFAKKS